jgi:hypothetical protein
MRDRLADPASEWLPSDDLLREQSYLVARGVRPMAHVGECPSDPTMMLAIVTTLEAQADESSLPFVVEHGSGSASFGYAAAGWVVELYRWLVTDKEIPQEHRGRILGLLLGYSAAAVGRFDDHAAGRRYLTATPTGSESR